MHRTPATTPLPPSSSRRTSWRAQAAQWLQLLQHWPWLDTLRTLRQRFREDRLGLTAGSLTFTTTIALVPLVTVMLAVFSAFPIFAGFQGALEKYFLQSLVPDNIARPVIAALTQFAAKANRLGTVGLVVLVVTAVALMLTIDRTLNAIWRVRRPRPIAQRVLVYWAALTLGPLLMGSSLTLTSYAVSASRGWFGARQSSVGLALDLLEFVLFLLGMAGLFRYVPNTHVRWRHALAGGLFVAVGIELAKKALAWYVAQVPSYSMVYGALATLPIFLVWIYCGWLIVLFGAVVAAYAPSLQMRVVRRPATPGHGFTLALTLLRELQAARDANRGGLEVAEMAQRLRTDPLQIEPVLDALVALDWVGRLDEDGAQRFVMLCDPASTPGAPLVERLLLERDAAVQGVWQRTGLARSSLRELMD